MTKTTGVKRSYWSAREGTREPAHRTRTKARVDDVIFVWRFEDAILFLSELGHGYRYEVGTNGNRVAALASLEASLKRAILDLKNLLAMKGSGQSIAASSSPSESAKIYPHSVITSREEDALQQHGVYSGGKWYVHTDKIYENSSGVEVRRREIASQPFHGPVHETADRSAKNVIPKFATVVPEVKPANIGKVAALKALHEAQQAKAKSGSSTQKARRRPKSLAAMSKI